MDSAVNLYNVANRQSEAVLQHCERHGLAFIPWFPIAAGDLARAGGALDRAAKKHGASVGQLALAWLLQRSPVLLPIPGTSSTAHLEEHVAASGLKLAPSEWQEIERLAKPPA